jgi:signal transduction histidine kinase
VLKGVGGHASPAELHLQKLSAVTRAIASELSLDVLLQRVVESAREIVGAAYAVLGVIGADGSLERFIQSGMDPETVARIGELPKGRGLIGALLDHPEPIRLRSIADDPRSCGLPPGHPPLSSFLGVPIRSATSVYGNLYLANRIGLPEFSAEDENLLTALAATAGVAIQNARLYGQSNRRQQWLRASADISRRLLASDAAGLPLLDDIAGAIRRLASAETVNLSLPVSGEEDRLEVVVTSGPGSSALRGLRYQASGSIAWQAMHAERGFVVEDVGKRLSGYDDLRSALTSTDLMALPLKGEGASRGAFVVGRVNHQPFTADDLEMAEGFTRQATLALELADARAARHHLGLLEDRGRIARDLHDHVVQKLFAAGLTIQGTATMAKSPEVRARLTGTIDMLDDSIRSIRTSIFALQGQGAPLASVRSRVGVVLAELGPVLGFTPILQFEGPLDTVVDEALAAEVEAVLRESLTNVGKHAHATQALVDLGADGRLLRLTVSDDGVGLGAATRRSGLDNLRRRAERLGGYLELGRSIENGLLLRWTVPLP